MRSLSMIDIGIPSEYVPAVDDVDTGLGARVGIDADPLSNRVENAKKRGSCFDVLLLGTKLPFFQEGGEKTREAEEAETTDRYDCGFDGRTGSSESGVTLAEAMAIVGRVGDDVGDVDDIHGEGEKDGDAKEDDVLERPYEALRSSSSREDVDSSGNGGGSDVDGLRKDEEDPTATVDGAKCVIVAEEAGVAAPAVEPGVLTTSVGVDRRGSSIDSRKEHAALDPQVKGAVGGTVNDVSVVVGPTWDCVREKGTPATVMVTVEQVEKENEGGKRRQRDEVEDSKSIPSASSTREMRSPLGATARAAATTANVADLSTTVRTISISPRDGDVAVAEEPDANVADLCTTVTTINVSPRNGDSAAAEEPEPEPEPEHVAVVVPTVHPPEAGSCAPTPEKSEIDRAREGVKFETAPDAGETIIAAEEQQRRATAAAAFASTSATSCRDADTVVVVAVVENGLGPDTGNGAVRGTDETSISADVSYTEASPVATAMPAVLPPTGMDMSTPTYASASREFGRLGDCITPDDMVMVVKDGMKLLAEDAARISVSVSTSMPYVSSYGGGTTRERR